VPRFAVSTAIIALGTALSAAQAALATQPSAACTFLPADVPPGHGVIVRLLTAEQAAVTTQRVLDTQGWIVDPRYASYRSVIVRVEGHRPLERAMVPPDMVVKVGEHVTLAWAHPIAGKPCTRVPNFIVVPAVSGLTPQARNS
jgi:hypothetical protein